MKGLSEQFARAVGEECLAAGFNHNHLASIEALARLITSDGTPADPTLSRDLLAHIDFRVQQQIEWYPAELKPPVSPATDQAFYRSLWAHYALLENTAVLGARPELPNKAFAQALLSTLALAADERGTIGRERVHELFGAAGAAAHDELQRHIEHRGASTFPSGVLRLLRPDSLALRTVGLSYDRSDIRRRMPVLSEVREYLGTDAHTFKGFIPTVVQHLMPTHIIDDLEETGLELRSGGVLGKSQSAHPTVVANLLSRDVPLITLNTKSGRLKPGEPLEHFQVPDDVIAMNSEMATAGYLHLKRLFAGLKPNDNRRLLLVDEGGFLITLLHRPEFAEHRHRVVAVEHTESGMRKVEALAKSGQLEVRVVDAARSWLKKIYESPMIGESIAHSTLSAIAADAPQLSVGAHVGFIGLGPVNQQTGKAFARRGFGVSFYDIDPAKIPTGEALGFASTTREQLLAQERLIISSTGKPSTVTVADFDQAGHDIVWANGGSGIEIDPEYHPPRVDPPADPFELVELNPPPPPYSDPLWDRHDDGSRFSEIAGHSVRLGDGNDSLGDEHVVVPAQNGTRHLVLNHGKVINHKPGVPPEYIQLTRALIYGGAVQASRLPADAPPGVYAVDDELQRFILGRTQQHLHKLGRTLEEPNFDGLQPAV